MWPLESANTDSELREHVELEESSVTAHGSTGRRWRSQELGEVVDDDVGAVLEQRLALADAVDADDVAELPGAPGLDAGQRVLEHRRLVGPHAEPARALEERVRRGLAAQAERVDDVAVDARLDVLGRAR